MRFWRWRKAPPVGTVTVAITADTSRVIDAMDRAAESILLSRYRRRIADERRQGRAFVAQLVAQVRHDLGIREYYVMANANRCTVHPQHVMVNQGRREWLEADLFLCDCGEKRIGNTDERRARRRA